MGIYLDKFRSTIPALQNRQIGKLLTERRQNGQIRTVEEFKVELENLTKELSVSFLTPTLKLFMAESGQKIDSESFNFMMNRVLDDLSSAFSEAEAISDILDLHNTLIVDVILRGMTLALNELDSRVTLYEFLNTDNRGFNDAQFNTFKETQIFNTPRSDANAGLVYGDPRIKDSISATQNAGIDVIGERLILGPNEDTNVPIKSIRQVFDSETQQTELHVALDEENLDLNNVIDGQKNTYWLYSTLLGNVKDEGVNTKIELTMQGTSDVNSLLIEPALLFPVTLQEIVYIDTAGLPQTLSFSPVVINRSCSLSFAPITTSKIILTFNQKNSTEIQFQLKNGTELFGNRNDIDVEINLESIENDLKEIFSSPFLLEDILGVSEDPGLDQLKFREYQIGFDNISTRFTNYDIRSIFVGSQKEVAAIGQAGLRTVETRPVTLSGSSNISSTSDTYITSSTNPPRLGSFVSEGLEWIDESGIDSFYHSSIEYYLYKQNFNENNALINTDTIPVIPLGAEIITHERLILNEQSTGTISDIGSPRFYLSLTIPGSSTLIGSDDFRLKNSVFRDRIRVYRDGTEIPNKDEFDTPNDGYTIVDNANDKIDSPGQGAAMGVKIQIENPSPTSIYTISYVPDRGNTFSIPKEETGTEELKIIDMSGDRTVRLGPENIIAFSNEKQSATISTSKLYLTIILRQNSSEVTVTPAVEEYMLVTGNINQNRFVSDFNA